MLKFKIDQTQFDALNDDFKSLYSEQKDGSYTLSNIEGMKPLDEFEKINTSLRASRAENLSLKNKYSALGDRDIDEILKELDRIPELETLAASNATDEEKINKLVEARTASMSSQFERKITAITQERDEAINGRQQLTETLNRHTIEGRIRGLSKDKINQEALEDAIFYGLSMLQVDSSGEVVTKESGGFVEGISAEDWLSDMVSKKTLWQIPNTSGGARTVNTGVTTITVNPWTKESWNRTEQSQIIENDSKKAEQLAARAGVAVYALEPKKD